MQEGVPELALERVSEVVTAQVLEGVLEVDSVQGLGVAPEGAMGRGLGQGLEGFHLKHLTRVKRAPHARFLHKFLQV